MIGFVPLLILQHLLVQSHGQGVNALVVDPTKYSYDMATTSSVDLSDQLPNVKCFRCQSTPHLDISIVPLDNDVAIVCNVEERDYSLVVETFYGQSVTNAAYGQTVDSSLSNDGFSATVIDVNDKIVTMLHHTGSVPFDWANTELSFVADSAEFYNLTTAYNQSNTNRQGVCRVASSITDSGVGRTSVAVVMTNEIDEVQTIRMTRLDASRAFGCWVHNQTHVDCKEVLVDSNYDLTQVSGTMSIALSGTTTSDEYETQSVVTQMDVASLTSTSVLTCWTFNRHVTNNAIKCNALVKDAGTGEWSTLRSVEVTADQAGRSALRLVRLKDLVVVLCYPDHDTGVNYDLKCTLIVDDETTLTSSSGTSATTVTVGRLDSDSLTSETSEANYDVTRMSDKTALVCWRDGSDSGKNGKCYMLEVNADSTALIKRGTAGFVVSSPQTNCDSGGYPGAFNLRVTSTTPTSAVVCFAYSSSVYSSLVPPPGRFVSCVGVGWLGTDDSLHLLKDSNDLPITTGTVDSSFANDINGNIPSHLDIMSTSLAAFTNSTTDQLNFTNRALYCYESRSPSDDSKKISCSALIVSNNDKAATFTGICVNGTRGNGACDVDADAVFVHAPVHTSSYLASTSNTGGTSNMSLLIPSPNLPGACSFQDQYLNVELGGDDIVAGPSNVVATKELCCASCSQNDLCVAWSFDKSATASAGECWLKSSQGSSVVSNNFDSGIMITTHRTMLIVGVCSSHISNDGAITNVSYGDVQMERVATSKVGEYHRGADTHGRRDLSVWSLIDPSVGASHVLSVLTNSVEAQDVVVVATTAEHVSGIRNPVIEVEQGPNEATFTPTVAGEYFNFACAEDPSSQLSSTIAESTGTTVTTPTLSSFYTQDRCEESKGGAGARAFSSTSAASPVTMSWSSTNTSSKIGQIVLGLTSMTPSTTTLPTPAAAPTIVGTPYPAGVGIQWDTTLDSGVVQWVDSNYVADATVAKTTFYVNGTQHVVVEGESRGSTTTTLTGLPASTSSLLISYKITNNLGQTSGGFSPALSITTIAATAPFFGITNTMTLTTLAGAEPGVALFSFQTPLPLWDTGFVTPVVQYNLFWTDSSGYEKNQTILTSVALTAINDHGEPDGCSPSSKCSKCHGDCDTDDDCLDGLKCFERTAASTLVPGCESTGMIASNGNDHDYCWNPYETPPVQTLETNVRGLLGGQSYTYQLAAYDECCGLGPKSTGQVFALPAATAPDVVHAPLLPISSNDSHVRLQFKVPSDGGSPISKYTVFRQIVDVEVQDITVGGLDNLLRTPGQNGGQYRLQQIGNNDRNSLTTACLNWDADATAVKNAIDSMSSPSIVNTTNDTTTVTVAAVDTGSNSSTKFRVEFLAPSGSLNLIEVVAESMVSKTQCTWNGSTPFVAFTRESDIPVADGGGETCTRYSRTDPWSVTRSFDLWRPNTTTTASVVARPLFVYLHSAGANSDECIKNGWVEEVVGRRGGYLLCLETDLDAPSQHFSWSTFFIEYNPLTVKGWKIPHLLDGISVSDLTGILVSQSASASASKCDTSRHQDLWYVQNVTQGAINSLHNIDVNNVHIVGLERGADLAMVAGRCLRSQGVPNVGSTLSTNFTGVGRIQSGISLYALKQKSWTCSPSEGQLFPGCRGGSGADQLNGYIGCYTDPVNAVRHDLRVRINIDTIPLNNSIMSVDWCRARCSAAGYTYFGIQRNQINVEQYECRCDNSYKTQGVQVNHNGCSHPCPGNANQMCGGPNINAVYHTAVPAVDDTSTGFVVEYPMGFGAAPLLSTRYCHFVTKTNPLLSYDSVEYARTQAKTLAQPFMVYKMHDCLQSGWDKAYDSEMFRCLSKSSIQDVEATATVPSIFPDFTGSAGGRTPVYPTCSRISSPAAMANVLQPCIPFQQKVPLNTSTDGFIPSTTVSSGSTAGYKHPNTLVERTAVGLINQSWDVHMYVEASDLTATASTVDDQYLHTMDVIGLEAQTTYTFALAATNQVPLTSSRGAESYPVKTANPNPPDMPSSVPTPTGFGAYFINLTWNTPFSDGGLEIFPSSYVIQYNTSTVSTRITVPASDITVHDPIYIDATHINQQ